MEDILYLDTARIGRPSKRTVQAANDSLLLASAEGGSAYFEQLLHDGLPACPEWMRSRYPGLQSWRGVAALKADLRTLVGGPPDLPVLLANRSAQLMVFASRLLFPRCRNVLTCDLGWPAYQAVLERHAEQLSGRLSVVSLRDMVFTGRATAEDVLDVVASTYADSQCDGLFLPAISNLGVRLPIERIVRRIERNHEIQMAVVDGAQEFCHTATELVGDYCDLYLAGCHKWLGGHHPMGVGFYGRRRSRGFIATILERLVEVGAVDDPLLRFVDQIETGCNSNYTETVNFSGLFTCQSAVDEASVAAASPSSMRSYPHESVARTVDDTGWRVMGVDETLRSSILLARVTRDKIRHSDPLVLRERFRERGIGLTTYEGGVVRLSIPKMQPQDLRRLSTTFEAMA